MENTHFGKTITLSGGFDPIHIGHVRMFEAARDIVGNEGKVIVILNSDEWLIRKKGKRFMDQNERAEVIKALRAVDDVYIHESDDDHVCGALEVLQPDIFGNGGDRKDENDIPEAKMCKQYGILMIFNVGRGGKVQSSSWLLSDYA